MRDHEAYRIVQKELQELESQMRNKAKAAKVEARKYELNTLAWGLAKEKERSHYACANLLHSRIIQIAKILEPFKYAEENHPESSQR